MNQSHRHFRMAGFAGLALLVSTACVEEPSSVEVITCGDLTPGRELTDIRVSILDASRTPLQSAVIPLVDCDRQTAYHLPQRTTFGDVVGETWVVAKGMQDGIETVRGETRVVVDSSLTTVGVKLAGDCVGVKCAVGQRCVGGDCRTTTLGQNPNICGTDLEFGETTDFECTEPVTDEGGM